MSDLLGFLSDHIRFAVGLIVSVATAFAGWAVVFATSVSIKPPEALIGAIIVAGLGYLTAIRRSSGRVTNTEATQLWSAAEQIRQELRDECERLRSRVRELETRIRELEAARS